MFEVLGWTALFMVDEPWQISHPLKKIFFYLFMLERGKGREKEREILMYKGNTDWLPLMHPLLGTWLATQACALTGNQTGDLWVHRMMHNPLNHTSQCSSSFVCLCFQLLPPRPSVPLNARLVCPGNGAVSGSLHHRAWQTQGRARAAPAEQRAQPGPGSGPLERDYQNAHITVGLPRHLCQHHQRKHFFQAPPLPLKKQKSKELVRLIPPRMDLKYRTAAFPPYSP